MYSDTPNYDYDDDFGSDYDDDFGSDYDSHYEDIVQMQLGFLAEREDDSDSHKHKKQRQDIQAARKYLLEGTRRENLGGDTAFGALYNQKLYSDLILSVGDRTFFAHRLVLCAWSDVFKTMLSDPTWQPNNELCNERSDNSSGQVTRQKLGEEEPDALVFEDFLKFLYTATVALTTENVLSLAKLADKYMIPELHELCCEFIENISSDTETILFFLPRAKVFNMTDIVKLCHQSLLTNFNLLSDQQLLDIDAVTMLVVLDSGIDLIVESEYALFKKIEPWLTQCENDDIFVKIIKCIRFPFMNALQLLKVTTTAVFSRATEKIPDLPLQVWQLQTLFREGSYGDLPDEFSGPRLYLCQPNRYLNSAHQETIERIFPITVGSSSSILTSPWIKTVVGKKQTFNLGQDSDLRILVTKVSADQIEIKLRAQLPSLAQKYHTAMVIGLPNQRPRYFKASGFATRNNSKSPSIWFIAEISVFGSTAFK
ncbi:BTB/POZ domain-containing protein 17-like [Diadema setosum]|uniref:BTB/POZ domain-containing protein 17-like n=1 Tax=Diadema setosum TaxID=31175 RepID=UPI003B3AEC7B